MPHPMQTDELSWMQSVLWLAILSLGACSAGPPALGPMVRASDMEVYRNYLQANDGDARAAYQAWRSAQTGRPVAALAAEDAALSETVNPFSRTDVQAVSRGALIYQVHCAACHGPNADGLGPAGEQLLGTKDFHHPHIRMAVGMSDRYVAEWYAKTSQGADSGQVMPDGTTRAMPAMKDLLTREQIWLAITYLASDAKLADEVTP